MVDHFYPRTEALRDLYQFFIDNVLKTRKYLMKITDDVLFHIRNEEKTLENFETRKSVFYKNNQVFENIKKVLDDSLSFEALKKLVKDEEGENSYFVEFPSRVVEIVVNDSHLFMLGDSEIIYIYLREGFILVKTFDFYNKKISCIRVNNYFLVVLFEDGEIYFYFNFEWKFLSIIQTETWAKDAKIIDDKMITVNHNFKSYLIDLKNRNIIMEHQVNFIPIKDCGREVFEVNHVEVSSDRNLVGYGSTLLQQIVIYRVFKFEFVEHINTFNPLRSFCFTSDNRLFLVDFNFKDNDYTNEIRNTVSFSEVSTKSQEASAPSDNTTEKYFQNFSSHLIVSDLKCELIYNHIFVYGQTNKISVHSLPSCRHTSNYYIDEGEIPLKILEDNKHQQYLIICKSGNIFSLGYIDQQLSPLKINKSIQISCVSQLHEYFLAGSTQGDILVYYQDLSLLKVLKFHTTPIKTIKVLLKSFYSFAENCFLVEWDSKKFTKTRVFTEYLKIESVLLNNNFIIFRKPGGETVIFNQITRIEKRYKIHGKSETFSLLTNDNSQFFVCLSRRGKMSIFDVDRSEKYKQRFEPGTQILYMTSNDCLILSKQEGLFHFDPSTKEEIFLGSFDRSTIKDLAITDQLLILVSVENSVTLFDYTNGNINQFNIPCFPVITKVFIDSDHIFFIANPSLFAVYSLIKAKTRILSSIMSTIKTFKMFKIFALLNGYLVITTITSRKIIFKRKLKNFINYLEVYDSVIYASCFKTFIEIKQLNNMFYTRDLNFSEIPEECKTTEVLENFE